MESRKSFGASDFPEGVVSLATRRRCPKLSWGTTACSPPTEPAPSHPPEAGGRVLLETSPGFRLRHRKSLRSPLPRKSPVNSVLASPTGDVPTNTSQGTGWEGVGVWSARKLRPQQGTVPTNTSRGTGRQADEGWAQYPRLLTGDGGPRPSESAPGSASARKAPTPFQPRAPRRFTAFP